LPYWLRCLLHSTFYQLSNTRYAQRQAGRRALRAGVLQGSCRVSRVFKLLFSLPAGPSLG
jgi:hypothetical protein